MTDLGPDASENFPPQGTLQEQIEDKSPGSTRLGRFEELHGKVRPVPHKHSGQRYREEGGYDRYRGYHYHDVGRRERVGRKNAEADIEAGLADVELLPLEGTPEFDELMDFFAEELPLRSEPDMPSLNGHQRETRSSDSGEGERLTPEERQIQILEQKIRAFGRDRGFRQPRRSLPPSWRTSASSRNK